MDLDVLLISACVCAIYFIVMWFKLRIEIVKAFLLAAIVFIISGGVMQVVSKYLITEKSIPWLILIHTIVSGFFLLIIIFQRFYRDPNRKIEKKPNVIISPADGRIRYVKKIDQGEVVFSEKKGRSFKIEELLGCNLLDRGTYLIGIEMNILDVHINRAPVGGRVVLRIYRKGKFLSLRRLESVRENERVTMIIDQGEFKIGVIQIASRLVRRIVSFVDQGSMIARGERIGAIIFGSQVDVVIPNLSDLRIKVSRGERVMAGVTILAEYGS